MDREKRNARQKRYRQTQKGKETNKRYENSAAGKLTRKAYQRTEQRKISNRKWESKEKSREIRLAQRMRNFINRPIIAIDGEGIDENGQHKYVMLTASDGSNLINREGISSIDAFTWLIELAQKHPGALFVSFGFGYDVNMMLKDLRTEQIKQLRRTEYLLAGKWRMWWRSGKYFGVGKDDVNMTIWDLRSYFRGNFIAACQTFLGDVPAIITDGKAARSTFTWDDIMAIKEYNQAELDLMVMIAQAIRERLATLGIIPSRMDGAGGIATAFMRTHNVLEHLPAPTDDVANLSQFAFIGGRVECVQYGHSNRGGYQYDMRSAYPWALTQLPSFHGTWHSVNGDAGSHQWGLYQVAWWGWCHPFLPAPLPYRTANQSIVFPAQGRALVWSPEMNWVRENTAGLLHFKVEKSWIFEPDNPSMRPFSFMADLYEKRQALAQVHDGAADILKLGMAATWGKLAQRVGWSETRLPKYHHLAAAGLTTSLVRAAVYDFANNDLDAVVAFETDAVITRRRMKPKRGNGIGDDMGQWKETTYDSLTYCNSGLAFATVDGEMVSRTAGVPRGLITRDDVLAAGRRNERSVGVSRNVFIGAAQCDILDDWSGFGQWNTLNDHVSIVPTGKRVPFPKLGTSWRGFNPTICPVLPDEHSKAYELPWLLDGFDLQQYIEREFAGTVPTDMGDQE